MITVWAVATLFLSSPTVDHRNYYTTQAECERVIEFIKKEDEQSGNNTRLFKPPTRFCVNVFVQPVTIVRNK